MQVGVDYASVDGNEPPDFERAKREAGLTFAYLRRSYSYLTQHGSVLAHDPVYERDAARARAAGLVVGAYLAASFAAEARSVAEQVANFEAAGGEILPGDLPVALDVEFSGRGVQDTGRSKREVFQLVLEFVRLLRAKHQTVAIYTSHVQWHDDNGLSGPDAHVLDDVVLWQKTPYPRRARLPYVRSTWKLPHAGVSTSDPYDYWRVPIPWERNRPWLQQGEGDVTDFPGFSSTVDVDGFYPLSKTTARFADVNRIFWMQRQLIRLGSTSVVSMGLWSDATQAALISFQKQRGLVPDGIVGVRTYAALCS